MNIRFNRILAAAIFSSAFAGAFFVLPAAAQTPPGYSGSSTTLVQQQYYQGYYGGAYSQSYYGGTYSQGYYGGTGTQTTPTVTTNVPGLASGTSVVLEGTVNPNFNTTTAWFEYGTSNSFGYRTSNQAAGSGSAQVNMFAPLNDLVPNTTYYYRLVAQNSYGTQQGNVQTFQTSGSTTYGQGYYGGTAIGRPTVRLIDPSTIGATNANLHGTVNSNGSETTAWYEYGTTISLGTRSDSRALGAGAAETQVNFYLGGIRSGTTYYYRLVAQSSAGTTESEIDSFRTAGSTPTTGGGTSGGATGGTAATTTQPQGFLTIVASANMLQPKEGEEFNYTVTYKNSGGAAMDAKLAVNLPDELEFLVADTVPTLSGNILSFDIGAIAANTEKTLSIRLKPKDVEGAGITVPLSATLTYTDSSSQAKTAAANLSIAIQQGPDRQTASIRDSVAGLKWYTWLFILIILGIVFGVAYVLYRYGRSKRSLTI